MDERINIGRKRPREDNWENSDDEKDEISESEKCSQSSESEACHKSSESEECGKSSEDEDNSGSSEIIKDSGNFEIKKDCGNSEIIEDSGNSEGVEDSGNSEGVEDSGNSEGVEDSGSSEGIEDSEGSKGMEDSEGSDGMEDSEDSDGMEDSEGSDGMEDSEGSDGMEDSEGSDGMEDSEGSDGMEDSEASEGMEDIRSSEGELVIENGRKFLIRKVKDMRLKIPILDAKEESKPMKETKQPMPDEPKVQEESEEKIASSPEHLPRYRETAIEKMFYDKIVSKYIDIALRENSVLNGDDNYTELPEDIGRYISRHCFSNLYQIIHNGMFNMKTCNRTKFTARDFLTGYNYFLSGYTT